jgi:hypothetical protein
MRTRRIAIVAILMTMVVAGARSWADTVDDLISTLRHDPDEKVRLSAAISLGKLMDQRAVGPLTDALSDSASHVRLVAAVVLGKLVDVNVDADARNHAIDELERVANDDPDDAVRTQASRSFGLVKAYRTGGGGAVKSHDSDETKESDETDTHEKKKPAAQQQASMGVYVDLAGFKDGTKKAAKLMGSMRSGAETTYLRMAWLTKWPGGKAPTDAELTKSQMAGFYLDVKLTSIKVEKNGDVYCFAYGELGVFPRDRKIVQLGVWQPAKTWAMANAGKRAKDIDEAKTRCVGDLAAKMAADSIPVISTRAQAAGSGTTTANVR